jgi:hypothetical protein
MAGTTPIFPMPATPTSSEPLANENLSVGVEPDTPQAIITGLSVILEHKHPLAIRWMHWINFPQLALMIYSGLFIYWADSQHNGLNAHRYYRVGWGDWTLSGYFLIGSTINCISSFSSPWA